MLREVRCYSCKDTGHIRQNCPKNKSKFCNYCKKSNHYEKDCFLKNISFKPKVSCSICKKTNHTDKAVSYTHLDVYKRQSHDWANWGPP